MSFFFSNGGDPTDRGNQALVTGLVGRRLPPHGAAQALGHDVIDLLQHGVLGVVGDEEPGARVE
jgi:hypothetical protein